MQVKIKNIEKVEDNAVDRFATGTVDISYGQVESIGPNYKLYVARFVRRAVRARVRDFLHVVGTDLMLDNVNLSVVDTYQDRRGRDRALMSFGVRINISPTAKAFMGRDDAEWNF